MMLFDVVNGDGSAETATEIPKTTRITKKSRAHTQNPESDAVNSMENDSIADDSN